MLYILCVFGASAIYLQDNHIAEIAKAATETATFATLQHYPLGFVLSLITLLVIMIFLLHQRTGNLCFQGC
ncbi:BCCT family transporter [Staphylococcus aureus]|nr:BCCT family transporter [Staphylococcus aureus]